jgi:cellulose synthase operon protein YhjQ
VISHPENLVKVTPTSPQRSSSSAKDIDSLFSRAGMMGAKYREFPRADSVKEFKEDGLRAAQTDHASLPITLVPGERIAPPIAVPQAQATSRFDHPESAAHPWKSLERIFADKSVETNFSRPVHSRMKMAILSLAGGVGKTTLAVSLARILSGMHRQVLLADCGLFPSIPHHLGARGQRLGPLQFFYAPASAAALPVGMFRLPLVELHKRAFQELLEQVEASESLLLIDLPTLHGTPAAEVMAHVDHVLVPVTPDVHSIGGLSHLKRLFEASNYHPKVHYLINRFDESRALHHEIKERLPKLLGGDVLPFVVHEDPAVQEAAAHGITIVDYRPQSTAVLEIAALAEWLGGISDYDDATQRGVAL